ncbi:hypothetical protein [Burkholderia ubonensis]|uniref:hypothetical protein n=1 Tax=Burkholderia ubonensis TaxID=101571 RepID=UPI00075A181C|nr:hypothetical protein [Burkholderia ubonensis]KVD23146.1 hypothetical protein WI81_02425 [Burkholderia ubonensis]KVZ18995.1 hypothetical protein WL13_09450 [Burkholderia ubonensis]KWB56046.1 hypothetical protein WL37_31900 [Burkholderia ubonensis]KWE97106.1 hypothetical protein WL82_25855 [Burkholderia ubonensis]KWI86346.1 hypothetical protein WM09_17520 [Burkholderia ubonensis]
MRAAVSASETEAQAWIDTNGEHWHEWAPHLVQAKRGLAAKEVIGDRMRFELETAKKWVDFLLACGSLIALPVGAYWVVHNFSAEDTHEANPNISVTADVMPYDDDRRLLLVHVHPKNAGKVPIELDGGTKGDIKITVAAVPAKLPDGPVDTDKLPAQFTVPNFVSRYSGGYVMEPGIDYDELLPFVVPKGKSYLVRAEMTHYDDSSDDEVDGSCVVKVE